ncbi:MAG: flavodoxin family protein [Methanospirillaceae archaeon]|nr:flavodoxin family protein [Methanospirillaceae archaeon]
MKILGINASPKGEMSKTLELVKSVLKGAESEGADTKCLDLYQFEIGYCTACGTCYAQGECSLIDDFSELFDAMMDADGIVLGSPNYINSVTAPMKAMFDRMADAIHCQMFYKKFGCSVCTAGGSHEDDVVAYMNGVLQTLGATVVGGVGVAIGHDPATLEPAKARALDLGKVLVRSIKGEISYPEQDAMHLQTRDYFCQLVKNNKDRFAHEYDWYVQKGWMK